MQDHVRSRHKQQRRTREGRTTQGVVCFLCVKQVGECGDWARTTTRQEPNSNTQRAKHPDCSRPLPPNPPSPPTAPLLRFPMTFLYPGLAWRDRARHVDPSQHGASPPPLLCSTVARQEQRTAHPSCCTAVPLWTFPPVARLLPVDESRDVVEHVIFTTSEKNLLHQDAWVSEYEISVEHLSSESPPSPLPLLARGFGRSRSMSQDPPTKFHLQLPLQSSTVESADFCFFRPSAAHLVWTRSRAVPCESSEPRSPCMSMMSSPQTPPCPIQYTRRTMASMIQPWKYVIASSVRQKGPKASVSRKTRDDTATLVFSTPARVIPRDPRRALATLPLTSGSKAQAKLLQP